MLSPLNAEEPREYFS